jgi:hypothetical protein
MNTSRLPIILPLLFMACTRRGKDTNAPAPVAPPPAPSLPPSAQTPPPSPQTPAPANDGFVALTPTEPGRTLRPGQVPESLTVGRHRCSFRENRHDYGRRCEVTLRPDGSLGISAPGTALNPSQGFRLTATGSAPRYQAQGILTAFAACTGPFIGDLVLNGDDRHPHYVIHFGDGCEIKILV